MKDLTHFVVVFPLRYIFFSQTLDSGALPSAGLHADSRKESNHSQKLTPPLFLMAQAYVASSTFTFLINASAAKPARRQASCCFLPRSRVTQIASSFKSGSPLVVRLASMKEFECRSAWVSIRCEQDAKESGGLDVWLGRLAMVGFATVITVEIVTGKGLLENFGFVTPLPSLALVVTSLIGILAAVFIFQSATRD